MVGGRQAGNLERVYLVANLEQQQLELSEEASSLPHRHHQGSCNPLGLGCSTQSTQSLNVSSQGKAGGWGSRGGWQVDVRLEW